MTTVIQPSVSTADRNSAPAYDESSGKLLGLLAELDRAGLARELAESRALLARAAQVVAEHGGAVAAFTATRDRLVAAVAGGSCGVADAAAQLAAADSRQVAGDIMAGAVRSLRKEAVQAVRGDGGAVHRVLAGRVADSVGVAVDAGRKLADVDAIAKLLKPPPWRQGRPGSRHPWIDAPPVLPTISLDTIAGDRVRVTAWADASQASQEIGRLLTVARALHALWGNSSRLYPVELDSNVSYFVGQLAEPVQLAVADALGWQPGLHLSLKPGAPQPPASLMDNIIAGIRYPANWVVGAKAPKAGPYGGGARPRS